MAEARSDGSTRRAAAIARGRRVGRRSALAAVAAVAAVAILVLGAAPARAADGLVVANATTTGYPTVELTVDAPAGTPPMGVADLVVTEDGAPVDATVTRLVGADLEVVLAVDTSAAMADAWLEQAQAAVLAFLDRLPADVRVGLVRFGDDVEVAAAPTADRAAVTGPLGALVAGGRTPLYDAVVAASGSFTPAARERVIVLLSAGGDLAASAATIEDAAAALVGVRVEVVSIENPLTSPLALARLAIEGRGDVTAVAAGGLGGAYAAIADSLVGRYTITYRSTGGGSVLVGVSSPVGSVTSRLDLPAVAPAPSNPPSTVAPGSTVAPAPTTVAAGGGGATVAPASPRPVPSTAVPSTAVPVPVVTVPVVTVPVVDGGGAGWLRAVGIVAGGLGLTILCAAALRSRRGRTSWRPDPSVDGGVGDRADEDVDFRSRLATRLGHDEGATGAAEWPRAVEPAAAADDDVAAGYDYARYSALAGPLADVDGGDGEGDGEGDGDRVAHRVAFRPSLSFRQRALVMPLLGLNMLVATGFYVWLIQPSHLPSATGRGLLIGLLGYVMLGGIVVIEGMRLISSFALSWWAWRAHDPVPVRPEGGLRVAFTTTIVPSREPIEVVRRTLLAAKEIEHDGTLDVWLLDEGNDPDVRAMCRELGVRHFTRAGLAKWNRPSGRYRARTKHGNHNAWLAAHGRHYDIEISVDPDHAPLPNIGERLLGYFRDPDVAFVCGPQVYGNYDSFLTRAAESQAYLFQSVIQRAANKDACGMFVGTNHAYRISAWRQIGGFQDSITEDMATSFAVHGSRNPDTGNAWKSVYTPDVIAVGEGPATWTDFFSQQLRWARGTDEVLVRGGVRRFRQLSWPRRLHYALLCSYYPFVAIGWMLGLLLSAVYVVTGATGLHLTDLRSWFTLYADLALVQSSLYFWLRRLNVSPHEPEGSAGVAGMFVSMLATPVYVTALVGSLLKRPLSFVVTPKGRSATTDGLHTFRKHLQWAAASVVVIGLAFASGRALWAALLAPSICLFVSLTPIALWLTGRERQHDRPVLAAVPSPLDDEEDLVLAESMA